MLCWVFQNSAVGGLRWGAQSGKVALTPGAIAWGVHEGQAQPLVLLQGALVREAAVNGTHHVGLLLAVVDGGLGHVHWLPAEEEMGDNGPVQGWMIPRDPRWEP